MQKLSKGTYTKEFREQAVKLVLEEGLSLREAGKRLLLSPGKYLKRLTTLSIASTQSSKADARFKSIVQRQFILDVLELAGIL